ncbi:MAG: DUF2213 domain-containing protein [Kofleriaceae bacterium]
MPLATGTDRSETGHPPALLRDGARHVVVGKVIAARRDGDKAIATVIIHDSIVLDQIRSGAKETSLGYELKLDSNRYQRAISLDHLAIVPRARCGPACSLQTDAASTAATCACASCASCATVDRAPSTASIGPTRADAAKCRPEVLARFQPLADIHRDADRQRRIAKSLAITGTRQVDAIDRRRLVSIVARDSDDPDEDVVDIADLDDHTIGARALRAIDRALADVHRKICDAEATEKIIDRMPEATRIMLGREPRANADAAKPTADREKVARDAAKRRLDEYQHAVRNKETK